jgi:hypothetical protein
MAAAFSTEVPPNFITSIGKSSTSFAADERGFHSGHLQH